MHGHGHTLCGYAGPGAYSLESRSIAGTARPMSPEAAVQSHHHVKARWRWPHLPDGNSAEANAPSPAIVPPEVIAIKLGV